MKQNLCKPTKRTRYSFICVGLLIAISTCTSSTFAQTGPAGYTFCANEKATCSFSGTRQVAYGANGKFNYKSATTSIACTNATFGDPIRNVVKACYYANSQPGSSAQSSSRIALSSSPSSISRSSTGSTNQITLEEDQAGFCGVDGTVDSNSSGFTGSGFANTDNAISKSISWQVNATGSNPAVLEIRFANGSGAARSGNLIINNGSNGSYSINLADTGAWSNWATERITVDLVQGANTIKFVATTASGLANIDSLGVTGAGVSPGSCATRSSAPGVSSSSFSSRSSSSSSLSANNGCPTELVGWATTGTGTTGGGNAAPQIITSLSALNSALSDNQPRVILLSGTVDTGSSSLTIKSNKTLRGIDANARIIGGISVNGNNVIVQNLTIEGKGQGKSPSDTINSTGASNVWFDHLNVLNGGDGALDLTRGSDRITVSWNKFWYTDASHSHRLALLFGNGSEQCAVDGGKQNHTVHHNWFAELVDQRMPRLLFGKGHVFNNYYNSPGNGYAIGSGSWASVLVENNYFKNINSPHKFQDGHPSYIAASGNIYDNTSGNRDTGLGGRDGPSNDCERGLGTPGPWRPTYAYQLDAATTVPELVQRCAGPR